MEAYHKLSSQGQGSGRSLVWAGRAGCQNASPGRAVGSPQSSRTGNARSLPGNAPLVDAAITLRPGPNSTFTQSCTVGYLAIRTRGR